MQNHVCWLCACKFSYYLQCKFRNWKLSAARLCKLQTLLVTVLLHSRLKIETDTVWPTAKIDKLTILSVRRGTHYHLCYVYSYRNTKSILNSIRKRWQCMFQRSGLPDCQCGHEMRVHRQKLHSAAGVAHQVC